MSIWDMINVLEQDGELILLQPEFETPYEGRFVFATKTVRQELYGMWEDQTL